MLKRFCLIALLLIATFNVAKAGYLDENPEEVFSTVYERLGALPLAAARAPANQIRAREVGHLCLRVTMHVRSTIGQAIKSYVL
jgi:hypothetical protein